MGKGLRHQPGSQPAELERKFLQGIRILQMRYHVAVECLTFNPVHQHHWELLVFRGVRCHKQLILQVADRSQEVAGYKRQFLRYQTVTRSTAFLFLEETLHSHILACLGIVHLEHDGKVAAAHDGFTLRIEHGAKMLQLIKIIGSLFDCTAIFGK